MSAFWSSECASTGACVLNACYVGALATLTGLSAVAMFDARSTGPGGISTAIKALLLATAATQLASALVYFLVVFPSFEAGQVCDNVTSYDAQQWAEACLRLLWAHVVLNNLPIVARLAIGALLTLFFGWMADFVQGRQRPIELLLLDWQIVCGALLVVYVVPLTLYPVPALTLFADDFVFFQSELYLLCLLLAFMWSGGRFLLSVRRKRRQHGSSGAARWTGFSLRLMAIYALALGFFLLSVLVGWYEAVIVDAQRSPLWIDALSIVLLLPQLLCLFSVSDYETSALWCCCRLARRRHSPTTAAVTSPHSEYTVDEDATDRESLALLINSSKSVNSISL